MSRPVATPVFLALLVACASDPVTPPPHFERRLSVIEGTGQVGRPGEALPRPVVIVLQDALGDPVAGATVTFTLGGSDGTLVNPSGITDAHGRTAAVWIIGASSSTQRMLVRAHDAEELLVTASAGNPPCWLATCLDYILRGPVPFVPVILHTYDGSGQAVHPDLLVRGDDRLPLAMVYTPYPFGNAGYEDPSLVESGNGRHWQVPIGVTNPLARSATGYLSDPDIVRDPAGGAERIYYREVAQGRNRILLLESVDGMAWTSRGVVLDRPSHQVISPAVVAGAPGEPWQMWSVNSGPAGCSASSTTVERRTSVDGVEWSAATATDLRIPGQVAWHIDVQWLPSRQRYWALVNSYAEGGTCVTRALFLATSADGEHWQVGEQPLLVAGAVPPFRDVVYRSSFRLSGDGMWAELMLSGAVLEDQGYRWSIGRMVVPTDEALAGSVRPAPPNDGWRDAAPTSWPAPEPFDQPGF